ncbi:hypothetical protein AB0D14_34415 [Streptomyces sp. NPDC048484]|uniref:hypothetical protein n=1 Tax=Streptomyces sp. NPDC048484 TaxID=3155146 RepID=UPI00342E2047
MNGQGASESVTVGTRHPAFHALLRHATKCVLCTNGAYCITGGVLVKTLREASGEEA